MSRIVVLNPNSSRHVTEAMARGLDPLRHPGGPVLDCLTLAEGPPGIETQRHIEQVVLPLVDALRDQPADAYVIACFSDPGLALARETLAAPVVGIAESAMLMALGLGHRFGIVALSNRSIARHLRYVRSLGLSDRLAGDRPIDAGVTELSGDEVLTRIVATGRALRDQDGANVLILGCAGMGHYRAAIERALGLPVIDPTQAAVARAITLLALGYRPAG
jgi:Asp/Glu/hydantoin racemase